MWGSVGWGAGIGAGDGGPAYLIPESGTVAVHVNATDLTNGTAKVGGAWTQHGTVPFNSGTTPRPSVGVFSASNYFSQAASPIAFAAAPFTMVLCFIPTANAGLTIQEMLGTPNNFFLSGATANAAAYNDSLINVPAAGTMNIGQMNVLMGGVDGSGADWVKLNGGAASSMASSYSQSAAAAFIGFNAALPAFDTQVIEAMACTSIPSSALFNSIYSQILANQ